MKLHLISPLFQAKDECNGFGNVFSTDKRVIFFGEIEIPLTSDNRDRDPLKLHHDPAVILTNMPVEAPYTDMLIRNCNDGWNNNNGARSIVVLPLSKLAFFEGGLICFNADETEFVQLDGWHQTILKPSTLLDVTKLHRRGSVVFESMFEGVTRYDYIADKLELKTPKVSFKDFPAGSYLVRLRPDIAKAHRLDPKTVLLIDLLEGRGCGHVSFHDARYCGNNGDGNILDIEEIVGRLRIVGDSVTGVVPVKDYWLTETLPATY